MEIRVRRVKFLGQEKIIKYGRIYMKKIGLIVVVMLAVALFAAIPASADVSECKGMIDALKGKTSIVTYTNEKDMQNLLIKLDDSVTKLDQNKLADAIAKLKNYKDKVTILIGQNKISPGTITLPDGTTNTVTPQDLLAGADSAIACLQALMVT